MNSFIKSYRFLNLISIDIACGAMICALFFADIFQVTLRIYGVAALGISVWIIYTSDHLLDAFRLKDTAITERHLFHRKHFKTLIVIVGLAMIFDVLMIFHIRKPLFNWGLGLAAMVALYLLLQRWITPLKEIVGALLYAGGIFLPAWSLRQGAPGTSVVILMIVFILTALINLILFSMFDLENDLKQTQRSLVTFLGKKFGRVTLILLLFTQSVLCAKVIAGGEYIMQAIILFAMNVTLMTLLVFNEKLAVNERYRLLGDVVFLFPAIYFFTNG